LDFVSEFTGPSSALPLLGRQQAYAEGGTSVNGGASAGHAKKRAHAPGGGNAECQQKGKPNDSSGVIAFAPALEHGDQSDRKQDEGDSGENFDPHGDFLVPPPPSYCVKATTYVQVTWDTGR
jgi:hypothetical protein